jgi:nitroreductase
MAVLEAGRLAPSSFGLEPWQFFVSRSRSIKDALFGACFSQENIRTASCIVAIAVRTAPHYHPDSDFIRRRAQRFPGGYPVFRADYAGYWEFLNAAGSLEPWARAQGYIAATQMMLAAASLGVDSCAIEGYVEDDIRAILGLDASQWRLSMLLPLGYRAEDRREKIRENLDDLVVFKD